ncbi:tbc domain containing protein [Stylonychia lemnae]|uniref:Tbc domain containing protein n=1 Tax=Stylonychia lemnae TaxID=5949 RepID=A0A078ARH2_STYLE|nr:tbc domain containing protein [Stylonychia lemnae]|eukprot:CDW83448.1 tbc domain containing protein [Stylonychia lemnae]
MHKQSSNNLRLKLSPKIEPKFKQSKKVKDYNSLGKVPSQQQGVKQSILYKDHFQRQQSKDIKVVKLNIEDFKIQNINNSIMSSQSDNNSNPPPVSKHKRLNKSMFEEELQSVVHMTTENDASPRGLNTSNISSQQPNKLFKSFIDTYVSERKKYFKFTEFKELTLSNNHQSQLGQFKQIRDQTKKQQESPNIAQIKHDKKSPKLQIQLPNEGDQTGAFSTIVSPSTQKISSTKSVPFKQLEGSGKPIKQPINKTDYSPKSTNKKFNLADHISLNSARGPRRQEVDQIKIKNRLNKSVDDESPDLITNTEEQTINDCGRLCDCEIQQFDHLQCENAQRWLDIAYQDEYEYEIYKKYYEGYIISAPKLKKLRSSIKQDVERTMQSHSQFQVKSIQKAMVRVLVAYAHFEPQVSYVQGMNFIVAALIYHSGEVAAFWLLIALMDRYKLKQVFKQNLPGLIVHENAINKLGKYYLTDLFEHFTGYFATEWIMSLFLSNIPLRFNAIYLNSFFEKKWITFYRVAVALLKYYEKKILILDDFPSILGYIKQAREGCDYLLPNNMPLDQSSMSLHSFITMTRMSSRSDSINLKKHKKMWKIVIEMALDENIFSNMEDVLVNQDETIIYKY